MRSVFGEFPSSIEHVLDEEVHEYSLDVKLDLLWSNEQCKKRILAAIPELGETPHPDAMGVSLRTILSYGGDLLSEEEQKQLNDGLKTISVT